MSRLNGCRGFWMTLKLRSVESPPLNIVSRASIGTHYCRVKGIHPASATTLWSTQRLLLSAMLRNHESVKLRSLVRSWLQTLRIPMLSSTQARRRLKEISKDALLCRHDRTRINSVQWTALSSQFDTIILACHRATKIKNPALLRIFLTMHAGVSSLYYNFNATPQRTCFRHAMTTVTTAATLWTN